MLIPVSRGGGQPGSAHDAIGEAHDRAYVDDAMRACILASVGRAMLGSISAVQSWVNLIPTKQCSTFQSRRRISRQRHGRRVRPHAECRNVARQQSNHRLQF